VKVGAEEGKLEKRKQGKEDERRWNEEDRLEIKKKTVEI